MVSLPGTAGTISNNSVSTFQTAAGGGGDGGDGGGGGGDAGGGGGGGGEGEGVDGGGRSEKILLREMSAGMDSDLCSLGGSVSGLLAGRETTLSSIRGSFSSRLGGRERNLCPKRSSDSGKGFTVTSGFTLASKNLLVNDPANLALLRGSGSGSANGRLNLGL